MGRFYHQRKIFRSLVLAVMVIASTRPTLAQTAAQPDLTRPIAGRALRASSADPNWRHGNSDWRELPAGDKLLLADLAGPGVINHIWMTLGDAKTQLWPGALRDLTLAISWDNESTPSVQCPVGDFFALGAGQPAPLESAMVQVGGPDRRGLNCFWKMPFFQRARLELRNLSSAHAMDKVYFHIDWIKQDALPADTLLFHAQYRQESITPGRDYVLAQLSGRGTYVGTVLSVKNTNGFGEADESIFIDGETEPSISGTGSEDYFNQAWGFANERSLYHGALNNPDGSRTMYRWHVLDPIPFSRSLVFRWENWGKTGAGFGEMNFDFSSVAFYYLKQSPPQPSAARRSTWKAMK